MKVMVVDDSKLVRLMVRRVLEKHGYRVVCEASNGIEALEILDQCRPDVIVLDINMPDMDGLQVLEELAKRGFDRSRVVMLTAMDQPWAIEKAKSLGVKHFLSKPIKEDELIRVLKDVTNQ